MILERTSVCSTGKSANEALADTGGGSERTVKQESFAGENFCEKLKVEFFAIKTFANCGKRWFMGVANSHTTNEIELVKTRYEVATVDRSYHMLVYMVVWEAAFGQILPCV